MNGFADLAAGAAGLVALCKEKGLRIATAESCTGGLIAAALTEVPGSSAVFDRGFVTYSNAAKTDLLGIAAALIEAEGAVSEKVARAMAEGALARSAADIAVAVTGVAGPGGGTAAKPVGLVHIAAAMRGAGVEHLECRFGDRGRQAVRFATVETALTLLRRMAE
ncbi:CinA family protein [Faunimonas sp. B44]|uniref:CinA family protein n=1 Tax=Faunimonas sp. B44 TaxID=3461493 RepID=UPI004044E5E8